MNHLATHRKKCIEGLGELLQRRDDPSPEELCSRKQLMLLNRKIVKLQAVGSWLFLNPFTYESPASGLTWFLISDGLSTEVPPFQRIINECLDMRQDLILN